MQRQVPVKFKNPNLCHVLYGFSAHKGCFVSSVPYSSLKLLRRVIINARFSSIKAYQDWNQVAMSVSWILSTSRENNWIWSVRRLSDLLQFHICDKPVINAKFINDANCNLFPAGRRRTFLFVIRRRLHVNCSPRLYNLVQFYHHTWVRFDVMYRVIVFDKGPDRQLFV